MSISTLIPVGTLPADPSDVWALAYLFSSDWSDGVTTRSSFITSISRAKSVAEQRWGLTEVPRVVCSCKLQAFTRAEVNQLQSFLKRAAQSASLFPLFSDQSELTASATIGATVISCVTTNRRLFAGNRLVILSQDGTFEVATIISKSTIAVTLSAALSNPFQIGDLVFPLFESQIYFNPSGNVITDNVAVISLEAVEITGGTQMGGFTPVGTNPTGMNTYLGYPVFVPDTDYGDQINFAQLRYGQMTNSGIGAIPTAYGERAVDQYTLPVTATKRSMAGDLIGFFHSRGGQLFPFFILSPLTEFTPASEVSESFDSIDILAIGQSFDWMFRNYVGFGLTDGSAEVRALNSVVRSTREDGTVVDTLNFDAVDGLSLSVIDKLTVARFARFSSDEMVETWTTTEVMKSSFEVVELLREGPISIENLVPLSSSNLEITVTLCAATQAAPTYYQAVDCDGNLVDVWLLNTGQTLPYEFRTIDDAPGNDADDITPDGVGVPPDTDLTDSGNVVVHNGDIIEDLTVHGSIKAILGVGESATIRNLIIDGGYDGITMSGGVTAGALYGINAHGNLGTLTILNVEIRNVKAIGVYGGNLTITDSYIWHMGADAFQPDSNTTIQGCYITKLGYNNAGAHADGVQIRGKDNVNILGNKIVIAGNTEIGATFKDNSGVFVQGNGAGVFSTNITINDNRIICDNTGIHGYTDSGDGSSISIDDNVIDALAPLNLETGVVTSGNTLGDGTPIP